MCGVGIATNGNCVTSCVAASQSLCDTATSTNVRHWVLRDEQQCVTSWRCSFTISLRCIIVCQYCAVGYCWPQVTRAQPFATLLPATVQRGEYLPILHRAELLPDCEHRPSVLPDLCSRNCVTDDVQPGAVVCVVRVDPVLPRECVAAVLRDVPCCVRNAGSVHDCAAVQLVQHDWEHWVLPHHSVGPCLLPHLLRGIRGAAKLFRKPDLHVVPCHSELRAEWRYVLPDVLRGFSRAAKLQVKPDLRVVPVD